MEVFEIQQKYPTDVDFSSSFSIGIHPWFLNEKTIDKELVLVEKKIEHPNCLAIGECGLDKLTKTNFDFQKLVFKKQILLAEQYQKPVIIHCVKAFQEIIEIKKELNPNQIWILHGYAKGKQLAESLIKNGIVLSFGAAILKNMRVQKLMTEILAPHFLIETDDSSVTIQEIYQKIATLRKIELSELKKQISIHFNKIFKG